MKYRDPSVIISLNAVKTACRPAEEGQKTTLTCPVRRPKSCSSKTILDWRVADSRIVKECNSDCIRLIIPSVSRSKPFNMETKWACRPCANESQKVTACEKLEVYAKARGLQCAVRENTAGSDAFKSLTISCLTTKIYPKARCSFRRRENGGPHVKIAITPTYIHTQTVGKPVYYRSECSVDVPVAELGEGTHSFRAFIYPDVTDGKDLVAATTVSTTVTLTLPGASSYTCSTEMIQGYFNGKSASCTCSFTSDGYPKGQAQWYRGNQRVPGVSGGVLDISFNSGIFEQDTVELHTVNDVRILDICDDNNQIPVTCAVLKDHVYPAPTFSFSQTNVLFENLQERLSEDYYQSQIDLNTDADGPPPLPPKIAMKGKTYQGVDALNRITLAAGYTGDMTCRVEGGYPKAHTTQLTCGTLTASGGENVATLTFQDGQLNKDMDGIEFAPVVTFIHNTALPEFNEGDTPTFICTARGNAPPNLTITRKRTNQQLASVQGNLKTAELTHTADPLDCLDTDMHVCTGQNNQDVTKKEIIVGVKCKY
ncbi:hypothetical protein PoB_007315400 [Plakobranchus ocellatus]|uniref:Ig-like domain-containing protein n=1 Tax=Plakobranchus ocellatus TaxID=259542 RepID=A0AAV4DRJ8_9GAST|nr:hypothetical protein PoB_007315400 [Plakobranchus ocellatus]